jgi:hypothetical protein
MLKPFRPCAIVLALLTMCGGVAAADPVSDPDEPSPESGLDQPSQYVDTANGYRLTAALSGVSITPVPNMAATALSREGFVGGIATLTIDGDGGVPVQEATLRLWVQFGCQIDLRSGAQLTAPFQNALSVPFSIANIFGAPTVGVNPNPTEGFNPQISANVLPGNIFRARLAEKDVKPNPPKQLFIQVRDTEVKVDGCGGPVSVRLIATAELNTLSSDDWVNAYSDIVQL